MNIFQKLNKTQPVKSPVFQIRKEPHPFEDFKVKYMDTVSDSWCGAKWFEGTIWLYQGATASCHHNPFHKIELNESDPSSLQNTPQKLRERNAMMQGKQPSGCDYCWSVERNGGVSDRVMKTQAIPRQRLVDWHRNGKPLHEIPYMIELAFERTCNLACAYCGPSFSSKWATDVRNNGPYQDLVTDTRYNTDSDHDMIYENQERNPYVEAFFRWWPDLEPKLKWLRVTGGEPLMSPNFWRFLDLINERNSFDGLLSINTNLINHKGEVDRLIEKTKNFKVKIHTSLESSFQEAEYVRDGFERETWVTNAKKILDDTNSVLNVTTSVSSLTAWTFINYLELMGELKQQYGSDRIEISCNFVHYPVFMRVQLIPKGRRQPIAKEIAQWLEQNQNLLHPTEKEHLQRFADIMYNASAMLDESHLDIDDAFRDLKTFIAQYDQRRNKNFRESLDPRFVEWYDRL